MPVQATQAYHNGLLLIQNQNLDWAAGNIQAMLLSDGHAVNLGQTFVSNLVGDEISDPDYSRTAVPGRSTALDVDQTEFRGTKLSFGDPVTISARYLVIFLQVTNDADSPLLFIIDLVGGAGEESSTAAEFSYTPAADGYYFIDHNETAA